MNTQEHLNQPTPDELRAARIAGFAAAISHLSPERCAKLLEDYQRQDARREAVIDRMLAFRKA